jgi:hypothetical protein
MITQSGARPIGTPLDTFAMDKTTQDRLVTIARYWDVADADLAKAILATRGVEAVLADIHSRMMTPHVVREVRLQVWQADAARALEILRAGSEEHTGVRNGLERFPQCPNCTSYDLSRDALPRLTVLASWLLLGFPLLFIKRRWRCRSCGYEWKA